MDRYRYSSSRNQKPSFSSTLLDFIYQSVDQTDDNEPMVHSKTMRNVNQNMIEGNVSYQCHRYCSDFPLSDAERIYGFPAASLRPLRTTINEDRNLNKNIMYDQRQQHDDLQPRAKLVKTKTKSRAMKIYSYLKKGTQPISPGGRLSSFLVSFFGAKNATKSKTSPTYNGRDRDNNAIVHAEKKSKSSVNVFTPLSDKRNARYHPAGVNIFDESLNGDRSDSPAVKFVTGQNRHVEQTTRNLLKDYQKKVEYVFDSIEKNDEENEDDDDESSASYSSSDLFELDHLSTIGIMQELPLYETTSVDVNRAIAKGLLE